MNIDDLKHQANQAQFNAIFGGRAKRRAAYRRWLKANKVPKPLFPKISQTLTFNRLNAMTFLQDVMAAMKARDEKALKTETDTTPVPQGNSENSDA